MQKDKRREEVTTMIAVFIIAVIIIVVGSILLYNWLDKESEGIKEELKKMEANLKASLEVIYQSGYNDFKNGKAPEDWEGAIAKKKRSKLEKTVLDGLKRAYGRGYEDAKNGIPSKIEQAWEERKKALDEAKGLISQMKEKLPEIKGVLSEIDL